MSEARFLVSRKGYNQRPLPESVGCSDVDTIPVTAEVATGGTDYENTAKQINLFFLFFCRLGQSSICHHSHHFS